MQERHRSLRERGRRGGRRAKRRAIALVSSRWLANIALRMLVPACCRYQKVASGMNRTRGWWGDALSLRQGMDRTRDSGGRLRSEEAPHPGMPPPQMG